MAVGLAELSLQGLLKTTRAPRRFTIFSLLMSCLWWGPTQWSNSLSWISQAPGKPAPWSTWVRSWGSAGWKAAWWLHFYKQHQPALPSKGPLRAGFPGTWSPSQKEALCHIVRKNRAFWKTQLCKCAWCSTFSDWTTYPTARSKCIKITLQDELILQWVYGPV